jgi:hypothetical protein
MVEYRPDGHKQTLFVPPHSTVLPDPNTRRSPMPMNAPDTRTLLHTHFDKQGAPWVDEIQINKNRIGMVAMVDGVLTGIEIKSGTDTLERLLAQLKAYRSRLRQVIVVIEEKHLDGADLEVRRR